MRSAAPRTAPSGGMSSAAARDDLGRPELALEPLDHPEPAHDLELDEPGAGDRGGVGRDERDRLDVAPVRRPDRRRRPERQRGDIRLDRAGPERLALLVAGRRDQRRPCRDAEVRGRCRGQLAEPPGRRDEPRQPRPLERRDEPLPVQPPDPLTALEVERQVADLARGRVDPFAGEPCGQPRRQDAVPADALPDRGLVSLDPVRLGVGLESRDRVADAGEPE